MRYSLTRCLLVGAILVSCSGSAIAQEAASDRPDTIYTNARVWTVNPKQSWAEAFAVQNGKFVAVGSTDEIVALAGKDTKVVDLKDKMVLPGLYDIHIHPRNWYVAAILEESVLGIPGDAGPEEAAKLIREYIEARPQLEYLFAHNLPAELFDGEPTAKWLDAAVSDRPAYVVTATGHEAVLNTAAMKLAGIDNETPDPRNGVIVRDPKTGQATGYMKQAAMGYYAVKWLPTLDVDTHAEGIRQVLPMFARDGLTSIRWLHGEPKEVEALHKVATSDGLPLRVSVAWSYDAPTRAFQSTEEQLAGIKGFKKLVAPRLNPAFVKVNLDGIPTGTAAMVDPFLSEGGSASYDPLKGDDEDNRGLLFYDKNGLANEIVRFEELGLSGMVFHAVGDRAVRLVLDAMEIAEQRLGNLKGRYQLAHAFIIADEDLPRFAKLNLTVEFSPVLWFPKPFNDVFNAMIGEERTAQVFRMRSVSNAGGRFVIASDGPLYMQAPLASIEAAVTRRDPVNGGPQDAAASEAVTLPEAIAARTINSAYLDFAEDKLGSIEPGKLADFVVLDRNLFEIPIEEVSEAEVLMTFVEGEVVFDAKGTAQ